MYAKELEYGDGTNAVTMFLRKAEVKALQAIAVRGQPHHLHICPTTRSVACVSWIGAVRCTSPSNPQMPADDVRTLPLPGDVIADTLKRMTASDHLAITVSGNGACIEVAHLSTSKEWIERLSTAQKWDEIDSEVCSTFSYSPDTDYQLGAADLARLFNSPVEIEEASSWSVHPKLLEAAVKVCKACKDPEAPTFSVARPVVFSVADKAGDCVWSFAVEPKVKENEERP